MNYRLFMARRLYGHHGDAKRVSRLAVLIATSGVAIGLAVMIISVCVTWGFKAEIRSKTIGFGGHVQVLNFEGYYAQVPQPIEITDSLTDALERISNVAHVQRFSLCPGMLKTDEQFKGIQFRGVGPEFDAGFLRRHLQEGEIPVFSDTVASNRIVVSRLIADQLNLSTGDRIYAYFFDQKIRTRRFTIAGIYNTDLTEFDESLVYTDIYTCNRLNNWTEAQCSGAELYLKDYGQLAVTAAVIGEQINRKTDAFGHSYTTLTIEELYPQLFAWLDLLDTDVWVILALMLAVAGFTVVSGLLILILERTNFIGIMKALGADNFSVRRIFLYMASLIVCKGMLIGNVMALGLLLVQKHFNVVALDASTYYVDHVPVQLAPLPIVLLNVGMLIISVAVLILPSLIISNIHPARSIKFE